MFARIELVNIKCYKEIEVDFTQRNSPKPLALLIGEDDGGKTTLLESLGFVSRIASLEKQRWIASRQKSKITTVNTQSTNEYLSSISGSSKTEKSQITLEIILSRTRYSYQISFDGHGEIIEENLSLKRDGRWIELFSNKKSHLNFNPRFYSKSQLSYMKEWLSDDMSSVLATFMTMYTFHYDFQDHYLMKDMSAVLRFFSSLMDESTLRLEDFMRVDETGGARFLPTIKAKEKVVQSLFDYLWPDYALVHFKLSHEKVRQKYLYQVNIKSSHQDMFTADLEPLQEKRILLCLSIIDALEGGVVIVDDLDEMIGSEAMECVLMLLATQSKGQCIISTKNTHPLLYLSSRYLYLLDYRRETNSAIALDQVIRTQSNNNNRLRYEKGVFGIVERLSQSVLQQNLDDYLKIRSIYK